MLDATLPTNLTLGFDWRDKLSPGYIVMFRFPLEDQTMPTEKIRCLVLEIEAVGTTRFAALIPVRPSRRPSDNSRIISIGKRTELDAAGLDLPTQFVVQDRRRVPLTHEGFMDSCVTGSPVIGQLAGASRERLTAARGRLHALRDIRHAEIANGDQPRPDYRPHRCRLVQGHDFAAEHRAPRRVRLTVPASTVCSTR